MPIRVQAEVEQHILEQEVLREHRTRPTRNLRITGPWMGVLVVWECRVRKPGTLLKELCTFLQQ